jgi:hypothetical protein
MNFELDYKILVDDVAVDAATLLANIDTYREKLTDVDSWEGVIVIKSEGDAQGEEIFDPILRLAAQWVRKIPWILGGDTETVAFRDSMHCYAFIPAGDSVEFSLFSGTETEIDEYVIEPFTVRLGTFANATLSLCEGILELAGRVDAALLETEDCRDLRTSLDESRTAWRNHQLHDKRR